MQDILPIVASRSRPAPVVDGNRVYKGVVSKNRFLKMLHRAEDHISDAQEAHIAQPVQSAEPAHETGEI